MTKSKHINTYILPWVLLIITRYLVIIENIESFYSIIFSAINIFVPSYEKNFHFSQLSWVKIRCEISYKKNIKIF